MIFKYLFITAAAGAGLAAALALTNSCGWREGPQGPAHHQHRTPKGQREVKKMTPSERDFHSISEDEWRKRLSPEQYRVLRRCGTEPAFTGTYYKHREKGEYLCAACGQALFASETKYDSGSGWPSFWKPAGEENVSKHTDRSHGMGRTEVRCSRCGSHLGHVFADGPQPTGKRYCINSAALDFRKAPEE
jgi:peptide-methionine (R)-S-oxide reductase